MKAPGQIAGSVLAVKGELAVEPATSLSWAGGLGELGGQPFRGLPRHARVPAALLAAGLAICALNVLNIYALRFAIDASVYLFHSLTLLLAAVTVFLWQRKPLPRVVRQRTRLWSAFLAIYGTAFLWNTLRTGFWPGGTSYCLLLLYAAGYATAFLAIVSPPTGRRWDGHWVLDVLQAAVLAVMFLQTRLLLNFGVPSIVFTAVLQTFLTGAALLTSRNATSTEERRLARAVAGYFFVAVVLSLFCNVAEERHWLNVARVSDALYPMDSLAALALGFSLHLPSRARHRRRAHRTVAMPVLTTAAILLLCAPMLRTGSYAALGLLACALAVFALRISLSFSRYEAEHRKLRQGSHELRKLALTDPLTGIANRRAFMDALTAAVERAGSTGPAFTLAIIDLDYLKKINDNQGHIAGDAAIRTFAAALQEVAEGPFDHTGRLGGDEFAAILPSTVDPQTWIAQLRSALRAADLHFSAGMATHSLSMRVTPEELIELADTRLYQEKQRRPPVEEAVGSRR